MSRGCGAAIGGRVPGLASGAGCSGAASPPTPSPLVSRPADLDDDDDDDDDDDFGLDLEGMRATAPFQARRRRSGAVLLLWAEPAWWC
jgi:hypothetical protein